MNYGFKQWKDTYKELFAYGLVGICTTVLHILIFYLLRVILQQDLLLVNFIAWIVAFFFSFIMNRRFVFHTTSRPICREMIDYFWTRATTMLLDMFIVWICAGIMRWDEMLVKTISSGIVIVFNYVISKFLVFGRNN